jgi:ketosteroid isomerase-like protein
MSQENVEVVRRGLWALENDADAFRAILHPEIEWFPFEENQRRLYGIEAAVQNRNEWLDTWDDHRIELEEVIDAGDHVIAAIHITASGKSSGVTTDVRFYPHFKLRDDRVVYIYDYADRADARRAVGRGQ